MRSTDIYPNLDLPYAVTTAHLPFLGF